MYKIYNPVTNKFASGGTYNQWTKHGKVWATMGFLKSHLRMIKEYPYNRMKTYIEDNCEVVNVVTNESFPVKLLIDNPENYK